MKLVKKAWQINKNLIDHPWEYGDEIVYADTKGQAKLKFYPDDFSRNGKPCEFLTLPVIRDKGADKVEYEGEVITRYLAEQRESRKLRHKELDKLLKGDARLYYILKRGAYYRPNSAGYTSFKSEAGIYDVETAVQSAKSCEDLMLIAVDVKEHNRLINEKINILKSNLIN